MKKHLLFALLMLFAATMQAQNPRPVKADTFTLKVLYLYAADLSKAADDYVEELEMGAIYSVVSPVIDGFTADHDTVTGKMPDHDVTDTVLYAINTYRVSVQSNPEDGGTVSEGGVYNYNEEVTVTAEPNSGYRFENWTVDDNEVCNSPSYTFNVTGDITLTANFKVIEPETHTVTVSPLISHGQVTVEPSGEVEVGTVVTIVVIPDEGYVLDNLMVFNKDNVSETVEVDDFTFVMPDFDVMVSAVFELALEPPVIEDEIEAPQAICAGGTLQLTAPRVTGADEEGWQMSASPDFELMVEYNGQALDVINDGWKLRYMASNSAGTVYSNVVSITVKDLDNLTLSGDQNSCTGLECNYQLAGSNGLTINWTVSDASAVVTEQDNSITVLWGTKGNQTVSAAVEDAETGCSATVEMEVTVQSYIEDNDVQDIVAKKHEGKAYLLIYPNPKDSYKYQWYKDGEAISGANGQYYYPAEGLADGDYQVYISYNADAQGQLFCGAFSQVYTVSNAEPDFVVYPNPAKVNEGLVVVNENDEEAIVTIYSTDGRLVHYQVVESGLNNINVNLSQGIYMVRLSQGTETVAKKVVIQ